MPDDGFTVSPPSLNSLPLKKYRVRFEPARAAGNDHFACGAMRIAQIARSDSGRAAHELGGGAGAFVPASAPATSITSVARPASSVCVIRGIASAQNIEKYGALNLSDAGRFSQI